MADTEETEAVLPQQLTTEQESTGETVHAQPSPALSESDGAKETGRTDLSAIVGAIAGLMMESPVHQHLFLSDMKWLVVPPVRLRQFRLFRRDGMPIAYASWAFLTEEAEARMKKGQVRLRPDEWNAGERRWLVDLIAPFGGQEQLVQHVKQKVFENKPLKMLQPAPDGLSIAVVEW